MLQIDFSYRQSNDLKLLYLYDTTGIYNSIDNPGGWGFPNPAVGDATFDVFDIQKVGDDTVYVKVAYPSLPNVTNTPVAISNTDLGLGIDSEIPDGQYIIKRTTDVSGETHVKTRRVFLIGQVQCCADEMLSEEQPGCSCESGKLTNASILQYTIFTLKKAFKSYKFERADEILRFAQSICKNKNCKTC